MALGTLFLDAGGVLVHPDWARMSVALARRGIVVEAAALAAAEPHAKHALDIPERIRATNDDSRGTVLFELVLAHAGIPLSEAARQAFDEMREFHARHNFWGSVPAEVVPALTRLRATGLTLVVVSNANGTLRTQLARLGLAPFFHHVLDSFEEGVEKPDPRLFRIALERAGARPEATVHVGDLYEVDVVGARAAGLRAVLLDPAALYADRDCPRLPSLTALADAVDAGAL